MGVLDSNRAPVPRTGADDIAPAPPSIGADVPLTYFGPAPSLVQRELVGPYQLLKAGTVDLDEGSITLPLYEGHLVTGESVWYIVTDTSDRAAADALGLNFSGKLTFADVGNAVRSATIGPDLELEFKSGSVDFSPEHMLTPGTAPDFFPPAEMQPGSVGDAAYSPLVRISNAGGQIYNAPMLAFDVDPEALDAYCEGDPDYSVVHDQVLSICPRAGVVKLRLSQGFSFGRPVLYLSTEATNPLPATLEKVTYAPALGDVPTGGDDSLFSAVERIFVMANGPIGTNSPIRQGLNSAISDARPPLNVLGGIPTVATDYSPLWDINLGIWTQAAIDDGIRTRVTDEFQILGLAHQGWIAGMEGKPFGSIGMIVNCAIVFRFL